MCKFSSLIFITPRSSSRKIPFIKTCGKCYDCLMSDRAAQVVRMKKEYTSCAKAYFLTLKYTDENLVFWNFSRKERREELDRIKMLPKSKPFDAYGKFVLEKRHASDFFRGMQKVIKKYSDKLLFRMVLNGEYGTWSHRPHLHVIVFSPLSFRLTDFHNLVKSVWKFGSVECSEISEARIAYVSKHSMKEDRGNELQQKVSPIFRRQSTYHGGIGVDLVNDETMLANYYNDKNYLYNGRFKVNIPRYVKKKLHPDTYSEEELIRMSKDSYSNIVQRIWTQFGIRESEIVNYVCGCQPREWLAKYDLNKYDVDSSANSDILRYRCAVALMRNKNIDSVRKELRDYYNDKFMKHKLALKQKGYFITDI